MVMPAGDLREAGIRVPLLVGGAALSDKFTRGKIAPAYEELVCYARDAMTGLHIMNQVMDPVEREVLRREREEAESPVLKSRVEERATAPSGEKRSPKVLADLPI